MMPAIRNEYLGGGVYLSAGSSAWHENVLLYRSLVVNDKRMLRRATKDSLKGLRGYTLAEVDEGSAFCTVLRRW
jgi:hypothetical protein